MKHKICMRKAQRFLMFTLFFVSACLGAHAQEKTVMGKIVDETGEPLPGVAVVIKGSTRGTISDIDGNYSISGVADETILSISFVGMLTQEVTVGNRSTINITMQSDVIGLEEMVVVGYGAQKKETLTGSIETIDAEVFEDRAVSNPALALQGQTPGLTITRTSSRPGAEGINFEIRGASSVNSANPLIIIDGVATLGNTAFFALNPDDIESMSILKDGSAAIYGARAAGGVILITTKRGSGKPKVNVSSQFKINTVGIKPPLASNPQEYGQAWISYGEQDKLAGTPTTYWGGFTEAQYQWMADGNTGYTNTSIWGDIYIGNNTTYDELFGTSFSQQHNVSLSGSTDNSDYRLSGGFVEDIGAALPTYDGKKQFNLRMNYNIDVNDWLRLESGASYFSRKLDGPLYAGSRAFTNDPPLFPTVNPFGDWGANFDVKGGGRNPVARMVDGGRSTTHREEFRLKFSGIINITKDLNFRGDVALDRAWERGQSYQLIIPVYAWNGDIASGSVNNSSYINEKHNTDTHETYQGLFNYSKEFDGSHRVSAMAGMTAEKRTRKTLNGQRTGYEDLGIHDLNLGSIETLVEATGGGSNWGLVSIIGRVNYAFKNKYLLEGQFRRDGSSRFAEGHKWRNFGGGSLGWIMTEESFLKDNDILSFLKLRASYGQVGNQSGIGNHDYASTVNLGNSTFFGEQDLSEFRTAVANQIVTNERTWETIKTTNFGFDARFLDNRLSSSFDYFLKRNDDMLISITYPNILGGTAPSTNSGALKTHGWELQVGWRDKIGEVEYNVSANISDNRNKLLRKEGADTWKEGQVAEREGYALNTFFMYKTDGFFATQEEADAYYATYNSVKPGKLPQDVPLRAGDVRVVDVDGNRYIDPVGNGVDDIGDLVDCGDASPHYTFGINLGAKWRNWDFSTFFQGNLEHNVYRDGQAPYPRKAHYTNQNIAFNGLTWTPDNTGAEFPRVSTRSSLSAWNYQFKDFMLMNGRYIRCKNLTLGYTFSDIKLRKWKIDNIRTYFTANDLFEFTPMDDGWDPEFGSAADSSYPFTRTWALGFNLTF